MPTRFWFSTTNEIITPDYDAVWDYIDQSERKKMFTSKQGTGNAYKYDAETDSSPVRLCLRQFISNEQFDAHNFTTLETWKLQIAAKENAAAANAYISIIAKVISNDGSVVRGTIINSTDDDTEIDDVNHDNRSMSGNISNNVSMQDGDRILIEIGTYLNNVTTDSSGAEVVFRDDQVNDLPEDDTTTGDLYNPWLELSASLSESAGEFVYAGDVPLSLLPSYLLILDRIYSGNIPVTILPSCVPPEVIIELISGLKKEVLLESNLTKILEADSKLKKLIELNSKSIKTINLKSRVYGDN